MAAKWTHLLMALVAALLLANLLMRPAPVHGQARTCVGMATAANGVGVYRIWSDGTIEYWRPSAKPKWEVFAPR